jgi:hypothetical protein
VTRRPSCFLRGEVGELWRLSSASIWSFRLTELSPKPGTECREKSQCFLAFWIMGGNGWSGEGTRRFVANSSLICAGLREDEAYFRLELKIRASDTSGRIA